MFLKQKPTQCASICNLTFWTQYTLKGLNGVRVSNVWCNGWLLEYLTAMHFALHFSRYTMDPSNLVHQVSKSSYRCHHYTYFLKKKRKKVIMIWMSVPNPSYNRMNVHRQRQRGTIKVLRRQALNKHGCVDSHVTLTLA